MAAYTDGDILIGGAYFGDHAVLLGRQLMGSGRHVHCFEPNKAQSGMLKKNADINQLNNLILQRKGLWNQSSLRLRLDGFDSFANVVLADGSEDSFETISVDDYCAAMSRNLGVVMLDIEGAELFALQGAANTIAKDKPAIVFELHRDYVDWSDGLINTPIVAFLAQSGYEVFAVRDFNGNQEMHDLCIELVPVDTVYLEGPPHGFNMLAVPNGKLIEDPMFRVVRHVSPKLLRHKDPALHHPLDGLPI
jgi:FkbM family methyltransferase